MRQVGSGIFNPSDSGDVRLSEHLPAATAPEVELVILYLD
jgi:hypothetical protein